jgi:sucrose-6-phosphate hydrolase SacC (GH32 family)
LYECPDYFELPVDGGAGDAKWVIWDASGKYFIGSFDGHMFTKESGPFLIDFGHNYYAAQTWNNAPQGRRIGIGWMRDGRYPDMPFNQQMSIPFELKLHKAPGAIRLTKYPVKELEALRYDTKEVKDVPLGHWKAPAGELFDVEAEIEPQGAGAILMKARGATVRYVPGLLRCLDYTAPLKAVDGRIKLRVLVDRTSIEVFANDGESSISATFLPSEADQDVELSAEQGTGRIVSLGLHKLHSVWDASY